METLRDLHVVRAVPPAGEIRAADDADAAPNMTVRFSPFGAWYEIDSYWEGAFLERTERGAFAKTIADRRDQIKVLYDHGFDPQIGNKVLGSITDLFEDAASPVGEVELFHTTSYVQDLLPGLRAGVYGSSFRFEILREEWNDEPGRSDHNPFGLPERTIKEVRLHEFGPVTFPANPAATAGVRSMTDAYYEHLRAKEPQRVDALLCRARALRTPTPDDAAPTGTSTDAGAANDSTAAPLPEEHPTGLSASARSRFLTLTS